MPINFSQQQKQALLNTLEHVCQHAIGAAKLANLLGYPTGGNQVQLRSLIKECIEIYGDLIGATTGRPAGFFIITNSSELEAYLDSLEHRTQSDNKRRTALINSWNRQPNIPNIGRQILTIQ